MSRVEEARAREWKQKLLVLGCVGRGKGEGVSGAYFYFYVHRLNNMIG